MVKMISRADGGKLVVILTIWLLALAGSFCIANAMPAPTGIAGIVLGPGHENATVIVIATNPGTDVLIDSFVTATDDYGRFVGVLSTDFSAVMDLYISVVSGERKSDKVIEDLHAGDDQFLEIRLPTYIDNKNEQEQGGGEGVTAGGGGGYGGGLPSGYSLEKKKDSLPPIDEKWASKLVDQNKKNHSLDEDEINDLKKNAGEAPLLTPKTNANESVIVYVISSLMTLVIILVVFILELQKSVHESRRNTKK